jgi:hypothetical protein
MSGRVEIVGRSRAGRFRGGALAAAIVVMAAPVLAGADDNSPSSATRPTASSTVPSETPSATPSANLSVAPSRVKVFLISPEESDEVFMCEDGRIQSVLATAIAEHRLVSITFVDQSKNPVPNGVWSSAYGFRLTHRQNVMINVAMICGN